jgi:hypothetical protein
MPPLVEVEELFEESPPALAAAAVASGTFERAKRAARSGRAAVCDVSLRGQGATTAARRI